MPVQYVGTTVTVHETATHDELLAGDRCIARHARAARHTVVMDPAHYAGLLRPGMVPPPAAPPQWDPAYSALGEVLVRDLATYAAIAEGEGRR